MILSEVLDMFLINHKTYITIENEDGVPIAGGNRKQDQILKYSDCEVLEMDLFSNDKRAIIRVEADLIL